MGSLEGRSPIASLYSTQRAMLQYYGPQHGKTWGRWVQLNLPPFLLYNVSRQWWEWHSVRWFVAEAEKLLEEHLGGWERDWWYKTVRGCGGGESLGSCKGEGEPPTHHISLKEQGHEPSEEWQCGPAPGQTGSHRAGLPSS